MQWNESDPLFFCSRHGSFAETGAVARSLLETADGLWKVETRKGVRGGFMVAYGRGLGARLLSATSACLGGAERNILGDRLRASEEGDATGKRFVVDADGKLTRVCGTRIGDSRLRRIGLTGREILTNRRH